MITHTIFSTLEVFENHRYNVFFNQLFTFIINGLNDVTKVEKLAFDGKTALLLQEEIPSAKFNKIELITNDFLLFKYLKTNITSLEIKNYMIYGDLIVLRLLDNQSIYIKYSSTPVDIIIEKGIAFRNKNEIK